MEHWKKQVEYCVSKYEQPADGESNGV
jgi:hypothetical protein